MSSIEQVAQAFAAYWGGKVGQVDRGPVFLQDGPWDGPWITVANEHGEWAKIKDISGTDSGEITNHKPRNDGSGLYSFDPVMYPAGTYAIVFYDRGVAHIRTEGGNYIFESYSGDIKLPRTASRKQAGVDPTHPSACSHPSVMSTRRGWLCHNCGVIMKDYPLKKDAHVSADPVVVNHCVFCGSGNLTGRSDGGVDCGLCNRTFTVMEQPLYTNMPATDAPAGIPVTPFDPLMQEAPFEDDPNAVPAPGEDEGGDPASSSEDGGDESNDDQPAFFASRKGVRLNEDDFVLHHAIRTRRGE